MRAAIAACALAALLAACATPEERARRVDTAHANVVLTEASAPAVALRMDQMLVIRLANSGNTEHRWVLAEGSPAQLQEQGQRTFERDELDKNVSQAAGRDVFRFRPVGAGVATLAFDYRRPRDREAPLQSVRFTITVK